MDWTALLTMQNISELVLILLAIGTFVTRLTPTTKDDGFMTRIDKMVQWVMDKFLLPNLRK